MPHNLPAGERKRRTTTNLAARKKEIAPKPGKSMVVIVEEERELWDRLPDEPEISFKRFDVYLRRGPGRKLQDVVDHFAGTPESCGYGNVKWLSRAWSWAERAKAYDSVEQQRHMSITASDRARQSTKIGYVVDKLLDTFERLMDDSGFVDRAMKSASPKEWAQLLNSATDAYKVVHGTKTITEGDAAMTFNGPVQVNVSDDEKARDLKAQISPYSEIFEGINKELAAVDNNVPPPDDVEDAEFEEA